MKAAIDSDIYREKFVSYSPLTKIITKNYCINKYMNNVQITKDILIDYYKKHSHSITAEYFNMTQTALNVLLNSYDIPRHTKQENRHLYCLEKYGNKYYNNNKKGQATKIARYGTAGYNNSDKRRETCLQKYGVVNYAMTEESKNKQRESCKKSCLEHLGVEAPFLSPIVQAKRNATMLKRYGTVNFTQTDAWRNKCQETNMQKYGVNWIVNSDKYKSTMLDKYGVEYGCQVNKKYSNDSKPNQIFAQLLDDNNIKYEREFSIENRSFDFKVDNTLIELDPTITHNSTFSPFDKSGKDINYHYAKTKLALKYNYRCIHIWDWDDVNKVISILKQKQHLYARKCKIIVISVKECNDFLNLYHLQDSCRGQDIRLGLLYDNKLVQVMTFGKPRYNNNYEYELLRLCTHNDYIIIGGAEKLFNYFIKNYKPRSIVSYCDNSKYIGNVYTRLGMTFKSLSRPRKHWVNLKTKQHITDNYLRQRGFDQLFKTNYGKGTSNEQLILENGFVIVYDCGQSTYVWKNTII